MRWTAGDRSNIEDVRGRSGVRGPAGGLAPCSYGHGRSVGGRRGRWGRRGVVRLRGRCLAFGAFFLFLLLCFFTGFFFVSMGGACSPNEKFQVHFLLNQI